MECECRGLLEHEILLLRCVQGGIGKECVEKYFAVCTVCVAAMTLAKTGERLSEFQAETGTDPAVCIQFACSRPGPPRPLDLRQNTLYSKEFLILWHVSTKACVGNPASLCQAMELFAEDFNAQGLAHAASPRW
eukprot:gnl/MRDRNA2_/MRDRNA2_85400_c0_seq1.p1 gnl/MRDRNA2_/MRDRNA2_85400_c0~~gnl/MRDRNA2_/MRDRNA2_85400_c0_seq1.p1  ORF type:complete len:134 (+),score=17.52 gnl/MRDRNA2_/MRDRNA2_85400_c0_seq1:192-593(+)